jgi:glutamine phosphoribosylpyrophosphate amidotransferase
MLHSFDYLRCHKPTATEEESAAKLMDVTSRLLAGPYSVLAMAVGSVVAFRDVISLRNHPLNSA